MRVLEEHPKYVLVEEPLTSVLDGSSPYISLDHIKKDQAEIEYDPQAKVDLAHWAGAPCHESDAEARLSAIQKRFLSREERDLILEGGSGLGKSALAGTFGLIELAKPNRKIAIVGSTYNHAHIEFTYLYNMFMQLFGPTCAFRHNNLSQGNQNKMFIYTIWNSWVKTYSVGNDDLDAVMGEEFDLVILAEGAKIPHKVVQTKLLRALARRARGIKRLDYTRKTGRLIVFTTPIGEDGYTYERINEAEKMTDGNVAGLQLGGEYIHPVTKRVTKTNWFTSLYYEKGSLLENPSFSQEEYAALVVRHGGEDSPDFQEQVLGHTVRRTGAVFTHFSLNYHVERPPSNERLKDMIFGFGMDLGTNFAAVFVAKDENGTFYVLDEVYQFNRSTREDCEATKLKAINIMRELNGESLVDQVTEEEWQKSLLLFNNRYRDIRGGKDPDYQEHMNCGIGASNQFVEPTLNRINELLLENRLFISPRCNNLIDEMKRLSWDPRQEGKTRKTQPDHAVDALRYLVMPMLDQEKEELDLPRSFEEAYEKQHGVEAWVQQVKEQYNRSSQRGDHDIYTEDW